MEVDILKDREQEAQSAPTAHLRESGDQAARPRNRPTRILLNGKLGESNVEPSFPFLETEDSPCPIDKKVCKHTSDANAEYILWIQDRIPNVDKKDASCSEWETLMHFVHRQSPCLCPLARRNQGEGKPNWAQAEKKAKDESREPGRKRHHTDDIEVTCRWSSLL